MTEWPESKPIKAEVIIHQFDAQDVPIKQIVSETKARKVDILAIGTKNTPENDLVYVDRL